MKELIPAAEQAPRRRPLWLVLALSILSVGFYIPIWFALSWQELKRELADLGMQPAWHGASIFLPVYGFFQAHRHFRALDAALQRAGATRRVDAFAATVGVIIWWLTWTHYSSDPLFIALDAVELAAGTAVIVYGQRALNAYWLARPGPAVEERLVDWDWLALILAASYFSVALLSVLSGTSG